MKDLIEELFQDISNAPTGGVKEDYTIAVMKDTYTDRFIREIARHLAAKGWRKQRKGKWIARTNLMQKIVFDCSECDETSSIMKTYCCHCGAKMKGEQR